MKVVAATGNPGKLREFERIFAPFGITVVSQKEVCPGLEIEENGNTFAENAFLKADGVFRAAGKAAIADDSGLCVDALGGRPGVYSARYGGEGLGYAEKINMLLEELRDVPREKRTARFVAHICYIDQNGRQMDVEESCEGWIGYAPKGEHGFGFDPVFMVGDRSFSELDDAEKDAISHRGKALRALVELLRKNDEADR